jgi:hypothetical protein
MWKSCQIPTLSNIHIRHNLFSICARQYQFINEYVSIVLISYFSTYQILHTSTHFNLRIRNSCCRLCYGPGQSQTIKYTYVKLCICTLYGYMSTHFNLRSRLRVVVRHASPVQESKRSLHLYRCGIWKFHPPVRIIGQWRGLPSHITNIHIFGFNLQKVTCDG